MISEADDNRNTLAQSTHDFLASPVNGALVVVGAVALFALAVMLLS